MAAIAIERAMPATFNRFSDAAGMSPEGDGLDRIYRFYTIAGQKIIHLPPGQVRGKLYHENQVFFSDTDTALVEFSDRAVNETKEINENIYKGVVI
ncbi:MAG: hypothetical protein A4E57_02368 [Syntrophorhabdaceae bacterium PtaU1.Bin034]|nr:MAG: hypothetical protein A4E57_02368 [Syntrophorhabdaceae bacterium PtaU1.Bin034]